MPTYEYFCEKCGHQFEKFQPMNAKPLTICPQDLCGAKRWGKGKVRKLISAGAGLIFKGSGFYITDYRSEKYKEAAKKETATPSPEGKPSESHASESKPAKSDAKSAESKPAKTSKAKQ